MSSSILGLNASILGAVITVALVLPTAVAVLASHLAFFEARACTGLAQLEEGSYEYEQRLMRCLRDGHTLPAR